jgi:hypothetical protein
MSTDQRIGPLYTFKVGQRVFYYAGGQAIGNKTGPFTVLTLVRQPDGQIQYQIGMRSHEHTAREDELTLLLSGRRKETLALPSQHK